jgi:hypothetical protein
MRAVRPLFLATLFLSVTAFGQTLPSDPQQTCTATIAPWFVSGSVTLNGPVNPADSLNLNTSNNCNFYLWSEQMFLWMTSPASSIYGGNGRVFNSPVFYGVTSGSGGELNFVPNFVLPPIIPPMTAAGQSKSMATSASKLPPLTGARAQKRLRAALRPAKRGPHGLPVVIDRKGRPIEITDAQLSPQGKPLVVGANGKVAVSKLMRDPSTRKVKFFDAAGNVIANPKPVLTAKLQKANVGQRFFLSDGTAIVVDPTGEVLDVSPVQAGQLGAVLLSQSNSVIFYTIAVNDVYAWFLTGMANGAINTNNQFPTTQADLTQITNYAAKYGVTLTDANALPMEVKMSWVDASTLSNPGNYITMEAEVPVYNTSNNQSWPQQPLPKVATLALLGMHVVGPSGFPNTNGHPEMLWATFEHFGNTANAQYQYVNTAGATVNVSQNTSGSWLFTTPNSSTGFNVANANYNSPPAITAQPGRTISGSNTLRQNPFGVAPVGTPNQNDSTPAIANTEVLSLNNSVLGQLAGGDVRANYYFLGTTWTDGGVAPTSPFPVGGNELGTSYLSNSTMETYQQWMGTSNPGNNCLDCHQSNNPTIATTAVSHIFGSLVPLFRTPTTTAPAAKKSKK